MLGSAGAIALELGRVPSLEVRADASRGAASVHRTGEAVGRVFDALKCGARAVRNVQKQSAGPSARELGRLPRLDGGLGSILIIIVGGEDKYVWA